MPGPRGSAHHALATPVRLTARPITLVFVALLVTAVLAVAIVLAANGGRDQADATKPVHVTPSAPTAGDTQRSQPRALNDPGARP